MDEEALDHIDLKLNLYLQKQKDALANWKKIKFRLLIISKFSSLKVLQQKLENDPEDSDQMDDSELDEKVPKWFIIDSESRNKQIWNMFTNIFYMVSFFSFPYVIAFDFDALED